MSPKLIQVQVITVGDDILTLTCELTWPLAGLLKESVTGEKASVRRNASQESIYLSL